MNLPTNRFKQRLLAGETQIGLWCTLSSPYAAEAVAGSGFDWLLLDTEHSPGGVETTLAQLQAVAAYPTSPIVRPAANDPVLIKKYLDIGAQTLLVPFVQTPQAAAAAVAAMHKAHEELCLLVQVETREALDRLEAIAAVDGVDGVFIGPNDLAASLGHVGNMAHPEVVEAVEDAMRRLAALGKPSGVYAAPAFARRCLELGCRFAAVGGDASLLVKGTDGLAAQFIS
jgi:4-hydroxy-2-oxoheptanedioate aldolase